MTTAAGSSRELVLCYSNTLNDKPIRFKPTFTNRKRPHHKVRTGCDTCKKRRLKCDETKPQCRRCLKAEVECAGYTSVPQTQLFVPAYTCTRSETLDEDSTKSQDLTLSNDQEASIWINDQPTELSHTNSCDRNIAPQHQSYSLYRTPSSPFRNQDEFRAQNLALHWIVHYTCSRVMPEFIKSGFWTKVVPQLAWEYDSLRHAMISFGILGASFHRKDSPMKYRSETIKALEHSNRAIRSLSVNKPPDMVIALCALMFWQLELVKGNVLGSASHIAAADQIAAQSKQQSSEARITAMVTEKLAKGPRNELKFGATVPRVVNLKQPSDVRKRNAVQIIRQTLPHISAAIERTKAYRLIRPYCESIISALVRIRQELIWIVARWGDDSSLTIQSSKSEIIPISKVIKSPTGRDSEYLFAGTLDYLDKYLISGDNFSIAWFIRDMAQELPSFLLVTACGDLAMRQDLTEFMEVSRLLREAEED